jgi:hypothetical protein
MSLEFPAVDTCPMMWPAAALAIFVLGFAVVYGSLVQYRLEAGRARNDPGRARQDIPS